VERIFLVYKQADKTSEKYTKKRDLKMGRSNIFNLRESKIDNVPSEAAKIF
jgi:hypothetical protein